jgi:hypothetical protein
MRKIETTVYTFDELDEEGKEKALDNLRGINVDFDWWEFIYEDAANIGLRLTSFDLERNRHATGEFLYFGQADQCAGLIMKEHGEICDTYHLASVYSKAREELDKEREEYEKKDEIETWQDKSDELDGEFLHDLLEEYSIMLQKEWEHLQSDESIIDTIQANEYEFTSDGKLI